MELINEIEKTVGKTKDTIWGIADIYYSSYYEKYASAIVLIQQYSQNIELCNYDEELYHQILTSDRFLLENKINNLKQMLDNYNIDNFIPAPNQSDEKNLTAPFSFKYAAIKSGLGWIGKSGVLVTKEFGPRIRIAAILIDYKTEISSPVLNSLCGECRVCVKTCPYNAIKGINWDITKQREELIDYQLCSRKRSEYKTIKNRKHSCGYCIIACPRGVTSNL